MRALARFLAPWRLESPERIPARGPFIVVTNHVNWKDPPWTEFALGRAIRYMGKAELFALPVVGFLLRGIGCFPVRRGEADRGALTTALAVLEAGQPLGYFPEGHRSESGTLLRAKPGVAHIALRSNALVVPIGVVGTRHARLGRFWRKDITLRVGEPFYARELREAAAGDPQQVADAIMRRIAALLPADMRGVYS